jgi:hypothetical protein
VGSVGLSARCPREKARSIVVAAELLLPLSPRRATAGDVPALVAGGDARFRLFIGNTSASRSLR